MHAIAVRTAIIEIEISVTTPFNAIIFNLISLGFTYVFSSDAHVIFDDHFNVELAPALIISCTYSAHVR